MNQHQSPNNSLGATPNPSRTLLPEMLILGAALFGLWSLVVSPMHEKLGKARAAHANAIEYTRIIGDPNLSTPRLHLVMDAIDGVMDDISARGDIARDQTALQAKLMHIGTESGVKINRVSPASTRVVSSGKADDRVVSFELECTGIYRDVVGFIEEIETNFGLTKVDRMSIRPDTSAGGTSVRARLRTLHFAFDTTPAPIEPGDGMIQAAAGAH